jgi:hypothetical protein
MLSHDTKGSDVAKKKDKKDKKKNSAAKLPKRIAGVKVPKELRAPGGKLMEAVRNPLVMDLAAAALLAAAAGLREGKGARTGGAPAGGDGARGGKSDLGAIIAATAIEGVRKLAAGAGKGGNGAGPVGKGPGKKG